MSNSKKARNYVAKHSKSFNMASVHVDRKKALKRGRKPKHKNEEVEDEQLTTDVD